jgi:phage baseplate assembly protein W
MSTPFLGTGWAFPVESTPRDPVPAPLGQSPLEAATPADPEQIALAVEERSIRESIAIILGTARGERAMRPTFGCGLNQLVFEPNDSMTAARASLEVRESLVDWEPRIEVLDVRAGADPVVPERLVIELEYRVRTTNNVFNLVYPFYLRSGSQAR